ncbi:hypothetical protein D917_00076 [Trichinella nativa]|uniref:Uncharacterized protein n=1 Tax=Trichinella nativa TaxID=6335 RepID=A0A1Y3EXL4_9BILA|nr:hypothetical protein D917_00076 [Trichinella nativa]
MQSVQCSKSYREDMGLIVDRETLNVMGDQALRRLTYIAIQVAKHHEPTLNNLNISQLRLEAHGVYKDSLYGPLTARSDMKGYLMHIAEDANSKVLSVAITDMEVEYQKEKSVISRAILDSISRIRRNSPKIDGQANVKEIVFSIFDNTLDRAHTALIVKSLPKYILHVWDFETMQH